MKWGFNKQAGNNNEATVAICDLRGQVQNRLQDAYKRLDPKNAFGRASSQAGGEESMIGSLLFSMLTWTPFMQGLELGMENLLGENIDMFDMAADPTMCAVFDGVAMAWDEKANKNRQRKLSDYPEGRRSDPIFESRLTRPFNLVSANDNVRLRRDTQAEIACMSEMLDMLSDLEADGVTALRLDANTPLLSVLTEQQNKHRYDAVVTRFHAPVRKSA